MEAEEPPVEPGDDGHDAADGATVFAVGLPVCLGGRAAGGSARGDIEGGLDERLVGGGDGGVALQLCRQLCGDVPAALHIEAQGGADKHQRTEAQVGGEVGHADVAVVEDAVQQLLFRLLADGQRRRPQTAVEDGEQRALHIVDEAVVEEALHGAGEVDVVEAGILQHECLLATEEGQPEGQADAAGGMLHADDLGLGILEGTTLDDDGVAAVDVGDGRSEVEALQALAAEGDELAHLLVGHGDMLAAAGVVEEQVEAALAVPVAVDEADNLAGAGPDEQEAAEGLPQAVGLAGVAGLLLGILRIFVGHGTGQEGVGHEILQQHAAPLPALRVLLLELTLYLLGLEVEHHIPVLLAAEGPCCLLLLHTRHIFSLSVSPRGTDETVVFQLVRYTGKSCSCGFSMDGALRGHPRSGQCPTCHRLTLTPGQSCWNSEAQNGNWGQVLT